MSEQSLLEAILNNAVDAVVTTDDKGTIESANPATERMFQYEVAELVGQNVTILMPSPYREQHGQYMADYMESKQPKVIGLGREVLGRRKDGQTFPIHLAVSEVTFGNRSVFTGIIRDVSDLKKIERELAELNSQLEQRVQERTKQLEAAQEQLVQKERLATLGQVSGGMAHEIRNPLNAVKTSAYYLLHAQNPPEEKVRQHLERIDRQVTLIDNVVTALSDVARLPEPKMRQINLAAMLEQILTSVEFPASVKPVYTGPADLPRVLADEHQLPIAFRNLIRNARDAMPSGGTLEVITDVVGDRVRVQVIDEGVGIPPGDLERILEPLYSTKARGLGLGLAITRTILSKNRAELLVESDLGQGSTFTVLLDRVQEKTN
ncbi:MAG: PAS domain S-box protein [Planctomycetales bacterium]|nr:PAS domain S-box protein [Planctomycetales bacterium]